MSSWGHAVRRLTTDEIARLDETERKAREAGSTWRYTRCKVAPKCQGNGTHEITYNYVTGRAGRVSWASKLACDDHAARTAAKHNIEITDGEPSEHALGRVLNGEGPR